MADALHCCIEKHNVLQRPTGCIKEYFQQHPTLHKISLIVNHLFRALAMMALSWVLPFGAIVNHLVCFTGSLFYRLTVETNCPFKFALPAFAGSLALPIAYTALTQMISGIAFASLDALAIALISLVPLTTYLTYVILTVSYDVDHLPASCCSLTSFSESGQ